MDVIEKCPICAKELELQQINLSEALVMCLDTTCKYPVGHECIIVKRRLADIKKTLKTFAPLLAQTSQDKTEKPDEAVKTQQPDGVKCLFNVDLEFDKFFANIGQTSTQESIFDSNPKTQNESTNQNDYPLDTDELDNILNNLMA
ncbi:hypothetical protein D910_07137 [Dendroctonus ponderosae]|uniref:Uncharacterized protein n=1 Tax=Dendroctonus ponderosae TaxID=77166 RepID=U4UGQ0_DENPD|nr:hypothetical protein D910_07137 [Dendroctonus ponderosae]